MSEEEPFNPTTSQMRTFSTEDLRLIRHEGRNEATKKFAKAIKSGELGFNDDPYQFVPPTVDKATKLLLERLPPKTDVLGELTFEED
jgi:16S rRNA G1207 methylase RsmC